MTLKVDGVIVINDDGLIDWSKLQTILPENESPILKVDGVVVINDGGLVDFNKVDTTGSTEHPLNVVYTINNILPPTTISNTQSYTGANHTFTQTNTADEVIGSKMRNTTRIHKRITTLGNCNCQCRC